MPDQKIKTFRERSDISLFATLVNKMNVTNVNGRNALYFSVSVGQGDNQTIYECVYANPDDIKIENFEANINLIVYGRLSITRKRNSCFFKVQVNAFSKAAVTTNNT